MLTARFSGSPAVCRLGERGFSLLEITVALGAGAVLLAGIAAFQSFQVGSLVGAARQVRLQQTARGATDLIAREVRRAGSNPRCMELQGIALAKSTELRVQSDLDQDGFLLSANEDVTYRMRPDHGTIERMDRALGSRPEALIDQVALDGAAFRYYDAAGGELVPESGSSLDEDARESIRRIRIDLVFASTSNEDHPAEASVSTNIDLRNRYFVNENTFCTPTAEPTQPRTSTPRPTATPTPQQPQTPPPTPTCAVANAACTSNAQCCSYSCSGNQCS